MSKSGRNSGVVFVGFVFLLFFFLYCLGLIFNRFYFSYGVKDNFGWEFEFDVLLEGILVYLLICGWSIVVDYEYVDFIVCIFDGVVIICFYSFGYGNLVVVLIEIL